MTYVLPWTYSGTLDDVVRRYSIADEISETFFERTIAKNIFFAGGILLNDGYLVNHPAARAALRNENGLLRRMINEGFVRVLSREDSPERLIEMPLRMAKSGNASFQALVASPEWPVLETTLKRLAPSLFRRRRIQPWPRVQMHEGFNKLIDRTFSRTHADLGLEAASDVALAEIEDLFRAQQPELGGARDKFEKSVLDVTQRRAAQPQAAQIALMTLANQAYHYNFGLCLTPELPEPIAVDTSIGRAFEDLLALDEAYDEVLDRLPLIEIPRRLPFNDGSAFLKLIDDSTSLAEAKHLYLARIDAIFRQDYTSDTVALAEAKEARDEYARRLRETFHQDISFGFSDVLLKGALTIGVAALGQSGGDVVAAAPLAGIAVGIATDSLTKGPREFLLRRVKRLQMKQEFDGDRPALDPASVHRFTARELRPVYTSMAFASGIADAFVKDLPRMAAAKV